MDIYINRDGQQNGPYSLDKINECLAQGSMQPTDLAFHEGLPDWIPLSQVAGVIINEASPAQPLGPEPEGVSAVSPRPNNKGKLLVFVGIGVGLIAVCATVGFFLFGRGQKESSPEKKAEGSTPKPPHPSPFLLKPITNLLSHRRARPKWFQTI